MDAIRFYEVVAQVIPVFLLALAVESRFLYWMVRYDVSQPHDIDKPVGISVITFIGMTLVAEASALAVVGGFLEPTKLLRWSIMVIVVVSLLMLFLALIVAVFDKAKPS